MGEPDEAASENVTAFGEPLPLDDDVPGPADELVEDELVEEELVEEELEVAVEETGPAAVEEFELTEPEEPPAASALERVPVASDGDIPENAVWFDLVSPTLPEDKLLERHLGIPPAGVTGHSSCDA